MTPAIIFVISALRALMELVGWLLIGRWVLAALAGRLAHDNAVLRLFDLLLRPPRRLIAGLWPTAGGGRADLVLLIILLLSWLLLGLVKRGLMP